MTSTPTERCGYVAIIGRPNVGKSTLLNSILGQKLSITSRKPQTTRHQILGIKTLDETQVIYVDTPGIHQGGKNALNRYMNRAASSVVQGVDVVVFIVTAKSWQAEDDHVLARLADIEVPVILVINKIDLVHDREDLLPFIKEASGKFNFFDVIPLSAKKNNNVSSLEQVIAKLMPEAPAFYAEDDLTNRSSRFLVSEILREKLFRELGQELPYCTTVDIEEYVLDSDIVRISAVIYVESRGQKTIIIGHKGARLKKMATRARMDMERLLGEKVYLNTWVKIREGWCDDERALRSLGYIEE